VSVVVVVVEDKQRNKFLTTTTNHNVLFNKMVKNMDNKVFVVCYDTTLSDHCLLHRFDSL
jgi:hypothetical protein